MDCIFCKMASKEVAVSIIAETAEIFVIPDLHPQAPIHYLLIPKKHIATINDTSPQDEQLLGQMILLASKVAVEAKIVENGYRLVFDVNRGGGQAVFHIHLHLLAGRQMSWPPG